MATVRFLCGNPRNLKGFEMPRQQTQLEALTPGQLARRWGVSAARVRVLVASGRIPGSFRIPAVGRYGATVKIPMASILQKEQEWAIAPVDCGSPRPRSRRRNGSTPRLKHFPELNAQPEPDAECLEDAQL